MSIASAAAKTQASVATNVSRPALLMQPQLRLSPEQFALVCDANPEAVLELAADGQLIRMPPRRRHRTPQHPPAQPSADMGQSPGLRLALKEIWAA